MYLSLLPTSYLCLYKAAISTISKWNFFSASANLVSCISLYVPIFPPFFFFVVQDVNSETVSAPVESLWAHCKAERFRSYYRSAEIGQSLYFGAKFARILLLALSLIPPLLFWESFVNVYLSMSISLLIQDFIRIFHPPFLYYKWNKMRTVKVG